MKTSVALVMGITCCLISGVSTYAWSGDLDSALENVTISTDAQNHPKTKDNSNNPPCNKTTAANCPTSSDDNVNTTAYQALTLQQTILNSTAANVTVNGAQAPVGQQANISIQGF